MQTIGIDKLCNEQKQKNTCKTYAIVINIVYSHLLCLHEFHDSKGPSRNYSYIWGNQKVLPVAQTMTGILLKYISTFGIWTKHLPNMARYLQQHLEILKVPMAVLTIDIIGHLPIFFNGNRLVLIVICPANFLCLHGANEGKICLKHSTGIFI